MINSSHKLNGGFRAELLAVLVLFSIALVSLLGILSEFSKKYSVEIPAPGGTLREGAIGAPRFINPLLAQTDADRDLVSLVYTGLFRYDESGELKPALAEKYEISKDGLEYTVTLKENLLWQDGKELTADDILFTIQHAKNPQLMSPKRPNWEGVEISQIDKKTVKFILRKPYVPFLENLTLGIMPKHLWEKISANQFSLAKLNIEPVGAGPYKLSSLKKDALGTITSAKLTKNKYFVLGSPNIKNMELRFYSDEKTAVSDLKSGFLDSMGALSPKYIEELKNDQNIQIKSLELQRIIAIFLNQNAKKDFAKLDNRKALSVAIDRKDLLNKILNGYGEPITGPLPESLIKDEGKEPAFDPEFAKSLLSKQKTPMSFSLTTANTPELIETAKLLKKMWETVGVKIDIKSFEVNDLESLVIGPRRYDAFLYGQEVVGQNPDPFAFWHSSQRSYPGYNIALYANSKIDKLLETVRQEQDPEKRIEDYKNIQKEISADLPAIFLFSPSYVYILPANIGGVAISKINTSSDRFASVHKWYLERQYIWKFLANK
ncbi:ABC transporter substrate-binding protein [Candidatus Giovannonibacteria bacterium]|nr:ABC transporter substrate-binding protein [Candidatus Giovannonibacteria bacterium]